MALTFIKYLQKGTSHFLGLCAHVPLPLFIRKPIFDFFIKKYGVNLEEIERDPYSFPSLGKFFVRFLKPDARLISSQLICPVDGVMRSAGRILKGQVQDVKGQDYLIADLLGSQDVAKSYLEGIFFNFYLAPGDYHHVHSPVSGTIEKIIHQTGFLWPVNSWSWRHVPYVLSKNERVAVILNTEVGRVAVVLVGALNVGSIQLHISDDEKNKSGLIKVGDLLGTFHLGSSVVVLFEKGLRPRFKSEFPKKIRYGQPLFD